jgi:hypothetical protein
LLGPNSSRAPRRLSNRVRRSASLVLVIGGTLLVTLLELSFPQFLNATKVAIKAFHLPRPGARGNDRHTGPCGHRAVNRRVDITFANGRDRPGAWTGGASTGEP